MIKTPLARNFRKSTIHTPFVSGDTPAHAYFYATYETMLYIFNEPFDHNHHCSPCKAAYLFYAMIPYFDLIDFSMLVYCKEKKHPADSPSKLTKWYIQIEGTKDLALKYFADNMKLWTNAPFSLKLLTE